MDKIRIKNLRIFAYHGVLPQEKKTGQDFIVNVTMHTDTRAAGLSDDLTRTTNYANVCECIRKTMTEKSYDLIETVAEKVATNVLLAFPLVEEIDVEIQKPNAPVDEDFDYMSVEIHRGYHDVYLSYGSNMGDSAGYIDDAIDKLGSREDTILVKDSTRIVTKPYGPVEQDDFLNGACHIRTLMMPEELLDYLHTLESMAGRVRDIHWGPRTLDLDIIFYDNLIYESETLIIPHIEMEKREFVLEPLCEIAPNLRHPINHKTVKQMLDEIRA